MKLFITGGSGFVGTKLTRHFLDRGFQVVTTGTRKRSQFQSQANFRHIATDTRLKGEWQSEVFDADIVINLAGRSIFHYWTKRYKQEIYSSRVYTTQNLMSALPVDKEAILLSVSAVGIYGDRRDDILSESEPPGNDFLARVCLDWEKAVTDFGGSNVRKVVLRSGIVLGAQGGAFPKMALPYRFFLGGPLGSGRHWFPWIHIKDYVRAVEFLIAHRTASGAFNLCSPSPVQNRHFSACLAKTAKRPNRMRVPGSVLRILLREFGDTLLASQRAHPEHLVRLGFEFQHAEMQRALRDLWQGL